MLAVLIVVAAVLVVAVVYLFFFTKTDARSEEPDHGVGTVDLTPPGGGQPGG